jgi:hypothetical protein
MTKLQRKHKSSVSSSSSFSSGENDSDPFEDPHDVNFPGGIHTYEQVPLENRPDSTAPPPGFELHNYAELDAFAEKVPLGVGENFSYPSRYTICIMRTIMAVAYYSSIGY